jgi:hypothetical protein
MRRFTCWLPLLLVAVAGCRPTACWSPDSKQIALDPRGLLLTHHTETRKFRQLTRGPELCLAPVWSPDGGKLYHYRASFKNNKIIAMDVAALDLASGATTVLVPDIKPPLDAKAADGPTLNIIAAGDKNALELMREVLVLAPSPDGKQLVYSVFESDKTTLWIANVDGSSARRLAAGGGNAFHAAWSPDSTRVAFYRADDAEPPAGEQPAPAKARAALEVVNADGTGLKRLWETGGPTGTLATLGPLPQWTPDGASLRVFVDLDQKPGELFPEKCEVWVVPVAGGAPARYASVPAPSPFLTHGPGGAAFFFAPKTPDEQDPLLGAVGADLKSPRQLIRLTSQMLGTPKGAEVESIPVPSISPDGSRVALAFLPKGSKPLLVLHGTAPGSKLEKIPLPLPVVGALPAGNPKVPARPTPAPKKPAPKKTAPKR